MSLENFEKFRHLVLKDVILQKELRQITERDAFISRVVEIGAENNLPFSVENVVEAMQESQRVWIERWI